MLVPSIKRVGKPRSENFFLYTIIPTNLTPSGIIPHDGKNIKFTDMSKACHEVYNFASTFSLFVPNFAAEYLHKSYKKDTFDLAELDLHNAIEHDGSLVRELLPPIFSCSANLPIQFLSPPC